MAKFCIVAQIIVILYVNWLSNLNIQSLNEIINKYKVAQVKYFIRIIELIVIAKQWLHKLLKYNKLPLLNMCLALRWQ